MFLHPLKLALRLLVVAIVVLWVAHSFQRALVAPLVPPIRAVVGLIQNNFTILEMDVAHDGPNETLRVRANLARPFSIGATVVYPFGWKPGTEAWMVVNMTLGGVLQYVALMFIAVLAWPVRSLRELAGRVVMTVPLAALLLMLQVPLSILAELWAPLLSDFDPDAFSPLLLWSRFLEGGGGLAIALLLAVITIFSCARRYEERSAAACPQVAPVRSA